MVKIEHVHNGNKYTGSYNKEFPLGAELMTNGYRFVIGKNETNGGSAVIGLDKDDNVLYVEDYMFQAEPGGTYEQFDISTPKEGWIVRAKTKNDFLCIGKYVLSYYTSYKEKGDLGPGIVLKFGGFVSQEALSHWQPVEYEVRKEYKDWYETHFDGGICPENLRL